MTCIYCGAAAQEQDHIVARSMGGHNKRWNLAPACIRCNRTKGANSIERFLVDRPEVLDRVRAHQARELGFEPGSRVAASLLLIEAHRRVETMHPLQREHLIPGSFDYAAALSLGLLAEDGTPRRRAA